uniref:Integrase catalytic domain-containing protein n=1 Tax=Fagus sylvatica TaxID=28930 RepID=A0A2N9G9I0_FAGSY
MRGGRVGFIENRARLAQHHHARRMTVLRELWYCHVAVLSFHASSPSNPPRFPCAYPFLSDFRGQFWRSSGTQNGSCGISSESSRRPLSNDIKFARIGVRTRELWLPEVGVSELFFVHSSDAKIPVKRGMLSANREFHDVAGVIIFPTHPGSRINLLRAGKTLRAKAAVREKKCVLLPARFFSNLVPVPDSRESELGLVRYGPASRVHRGVFGPFEGSFPIRIPADPDKFLAIREFHVVHGCVLFPMCPGSQINLLRVRKTLCASVATSVGKFPELSAKPYFALHRGELGFARYDPANGGRRNVPYAKGGGQFDPVFGLVNGPVKPWSNLVNLGQTWSNLVKALQTLGNVSRTYISRVSGHGGTLVGLETARSNLGQTSVNPSQTWSTLVKLGQTLGNVSRTFFLGVFRGDEPSSEQTDLVRAASFCVPTPEKIPGLGYDFHLSLNGLDILLDDVIFGHGSSTWHARLGHIGKDRMTRLAREGLLGSLAKVDLPICEPCLAGKACRKPFGKAVRATQPLELIHSDICGPMNVKARHGASYFLTFIDDYTRYGYVQLIAHRYEALDCFKRFVAEDLCEEKGIRRQLTISNTPQQNGVAERRNRTLLDMVRSMMAQANLPISFWGDVLLTAAYILNRVPSQSVSSTPYELWKGEKPNLEHLHPWGSAGFVHSTAHKYGKLGPRARKHIFIRYSDSSKGYVMYGEHPNGGMTEIESRDIDFIETDFPSINDANRDLDLYELEEDEGTLPSSSEGGGLVPRPVIAEDSGSDLQPSGSITLDQDSQARRVSSRGHIPRRHFEIEGNVLLCDAKDVDEPASFSEALHSPDRDEWMTAMQEEMSSMDKNNVWELVDLPPGRKTIGNKWVLKVKRKADGSIDRYKARLVAKGYTQREGIDYEDTFSPVVRFASIRLILSIVAKQDLELFQMDVKTAFLNGELDEEIYMAQPAGFEAKGHERKVCRLKRSIYGLKQSSRQWYLRFHDSITSFGFEMIEEDHCVYLKRSKRSILILSLYVDDILLAGNDMDSIVTTKKWLSSTFEMKDMGEANFVLGVKITRDRSKKLLSLSQGTYIKKILELGMVSRYQSNPGPAHWRAVKRILRYLRGTSDHALCYHGGDLRLTGYSDADWASDKDERKSTSGYAFILGGGAVSWCSVTAHAEDAVLLYSDSTSALAYAKDPKYHGKAKHIELRYHYIRDMVSQGEVILQHISTGSMVADPLTKPIARDLFFSHTKSMGLRRI